ncbi:hypothetical protein [Paraglaciecola sp. L3A3]|uniref:hypothetical protein n=1 Tax=Paraglaciecola sp. L3A3 TaxID=2686358 RepID=UPI00131D48DA|nr:hypothetical protein [Paraglaciecola sp. L3A3]
MLAYKTSTYSRAGHINTLNHKVLSLKNQAGIFDVNEALEITKVADNSDIFKGTEQLQNIIKIEDATAIIVEDGEHYRLPKNDAYKNVKGRICREVNLLLLIT